MDLLKKIIRVMDDNGIEYHKGFNDVERKGYASDGCEKLSNRITVDISNILVSAINGCISVKKVEEAVEDLTELSVKLSDKKSASKAVKLENERKQILTKLKIDEKETKMSIREETIKYLDMCLKAIDVTEGSITDPISAPNIVRSRDILEELKAIIGGAWDDSSKNACDLAAKIINDSLSTWCEQISLYQCDNDAVKALDEAVVTARKWEALDSIPKKKDIADDKYIEEKEVKYVPHSIIKRIIESEGSLQRVSILRSKIQAYKDDTERLYGVEKLREKRNAQRDRLTKIEEQAKAIKVKLMNGEIRKDDALEMMKDLTSEQSVIQREVKIISADIDKKSKLASNRKNTAREFDRVMEKLDMASRDQAWLYTLEKRLPIQKITEALLGRADSATIRALADQIIEVIEMSKMRDESVGEISEELQQVTLEEIDLNLDNLDEKKSEEEIDADLEKMFENFGIKDDSDDVEIEKVERKKNTNVGEDDL